MLKRVLRKVHRDERGITGLETAIIMIAFVVIAAVFAYTVLSAGLFASQRGQEAVYGALEEARASLKIKGNIIAKSSNGSNVTSVLITVAPALAGVSIDMTPPTDSSDDGLADSGSSNTVVISFYNESRRTDDLDWSRADVGTGDDDTLLETGEKHEITIDMKGIGEELTTQESFALEIRPPQGSTIKISKVTPAALDTVMILR